jgi:hypothetical protein
LEGDVDIYAIIFAALAVVICLRLRSVLGQRTGSERPFRVSAFAYRLSMIAAVLCAVHYVAYEAKWYSALEARITPNTTIPGPVRVVDGDTVVVLLATALCAAAALVLSYLHWKAQKPGQGDHPKKTKPPDGLLRGHPRPMKPFAALAVAALAFAVLAWHVAPDYVSKPAAFTSSSPGSAATGSACRCEGCGCKGGPGWRGQYGQCVSHANLTRDCGSPPSNHCTYEGTRQVCPSRSAF